MAAAPLGFAGADSYCGIRKVKGVGRRRQPAPDCLDIQPLILATLRMRSTFGHPEGGRHGCRPFSERTRMSAAKMATTPHTPRAGLISRERCFLLVTFLYSPLRRSPFGPASPFAPSAQCTSKEKYLAGRRKLCSQIPLSGAYGSGGNVLGFPLARE